MADIACMNKNSFNITFGTRRPKMISNSQSCFATFGNAMNSIEVFEVDLWLKGNKFTDPVNVIRRLKDKIIGIDFKNSHQLTYDVLFRQVKFVGVKNAYTYYGVKQMIFRARTSTIINAKFKGKRESIC